MIKNQKKTDSCSVVLYSQADIPLKQGTFRVFIYRQKTTHIESIVIAKGAFPRLDDSPVFVRVHSECFTGEVLGSLKCDCKHQLDFALTQLSLEGEGLVIYLRQEGRGIGLGDKIKAYHLQNSGLNTIEANHALGYPNDLRDFTVAAAILKEMGVSKIRLNTNNPDKIKSLEASGLAVTEIVPSLSPIQPHNQNYLETKYQKLGHHLESLFVAQVNPCRQN